jgi:hypothetical protein
MLSIILTRGSRSGVVSPRCYEIRIDSAIVELEWLEAPDLEDLREALEEIAGRDDLPEDARLLIIDSGTEFNPRAHIIKRGVGVLADHFEVHGGRIAIAVSKAHHYGISNMLRVFAEDRGIEVQPFYDVDEARIWLSRS